MQYVMQARQVGKTHGTKKAIDALRASGSSVWVCDNSNPTQHTGSSVRRTNRPHPVQFDSENQFKVRWLGSCP